MDKYLLGAAIQQARAKKGYTQEQLAEMLNISLIHLANIEGGRRNPSVPLLFQMMELFMRSPRVILSAERIMERVWGWDAEAEISVVWVHISNLRKKLSALGSSVVIRASRRLGYSLEDAG